MTPNGRRKYKVNAIGMPTFHNMRSQDGWVWLRHAGWETVGIQASHKWSASEVAYKFRRGTAISTIAELMGLTELQVEQSLRHELRREMGSR